MVFPSCGLDAARMLAESWLGKARSPAKDRSLDARVVHPQLDATIGAYPANTPTGTKLFGHRK